MRWTLCVVASILFVAACVSEPRRRPAAMDPSNPEAPEAPPASLPLALADAPAAVPAPDAGATVYTCPMHPEVRSSKPGTCPKCGMKLVPEKPSGAGDAGQPGSAPSGHEHGPGHGGHR